MLSKNVFADSAALEGELIRLLAKSVRIGGSEAILASKAISLIWITDGGSSSDFENVSEVLKQCITSKDGNVKVAAVHALAMITFLEDVDRVDCNQTMFMFEDIFTDTSNSSDLLEASLDAYGLLYSKHTLDLDRTAFNLIVDKHLELLDFQDIKVRISAGENIALILEQHRIDVKNPEFTNLDNFYDREHELTLLLQELCKGSFS